MNLDPSNHTFDEKDLTIKVGTNNLYGYKLFVSTASSTSNTDLVNIADNTKTIENLNTSYSASDFENCTSTNTNCMNKWGYRLTPNAPASSGSYGIFTPSDSTPIMESTEPVNEDTATMGFAAKIDYNKPAGQYELDLSFKALPTVTTYYMQDIATDQTLANTVCTEEPTVVIDKRDEQAYTIRRINGTCWMVENLQFTGTELDSTTSNIAPEYTPQNPYVATYYDLESDGGTGNSCHSGSGGYINSCIHKAEITIQNTPIDHDSPSITTSTVWYNYAAATAGTITGLHNTNPQLYDICPSGWRLPNLSEIQYIGSDDANIDIFAAITGGYYSYSGNLLDTTILGSWWSSTTTSKDNVRWLLIHKNDTLGFYDTVEGRVSGRYIRCVMSPTTINNLTYMQDFAKLNESDNAVKKTQVINSMTTDQAYTLNDIRDNQTYDIKKLGDGNVWMTDNLLLGYNASNPTNYDVTITSANTNITDSTKTIKFYDAISNKASGGYCYATYNYSTEVGTGNGNSYPCIHSGSDNNGDDTVWYNYAAASAGTITGLNNTTEASQDICSAGWRLPNTTEHANLISYVSNYNLVYGGYYVGGVLNDASVRSYWWSSSVGTTTTPPLFRNTLRYYSGEVLVRNNYRGTDGLYVRCVAK